jgi:lysine 2,3-aminomutase
MQKKWDLDKISISVKSHQLLKQLLMENPKLEEIMTNARNETEALIGVRNWVCGELEANPDAAAFYENKHNDRDDLVKLRWRDFAAIRILDYIDNAGREFEDLNLRGQIAINNPVYRKLRWEDPRQ